MAGVSTKNDWFVAMNRTGKLPAAMDQAAWETVKTTAQAVKRSAQAKARRRTGKMAKSLRITAFKSRGYETIRSRGVRYFRYQEGGTSKMAAHPALHPAAEEQAPLHKVRMQATVREVCR